MYTKHINKHKVHFILYSRKLELNFCRIIQFSSSHDKEAMYFKILLLEM